VGVPPDSVQQTAPDPAEFGQSVRQDAPADSLWNTDVEVTARWKSIGTWPLPTRSTFVWFRLSTNALKFWASFSCSPPIDPESSTTNNTSAVEMLESRTRSVPGWMTQWPTGLKL